MFLESRFFLSQMYMLVMKPGFLFLLLPTSKFIKTFLIRSITVELSRRSVARDLLCRKERDTRKRSALMICSTSFSVQIFDLNTVRNPRVESCELVSRTEVLPIHRTTTGLFLVDYFYSYDDVNQCYITGNNSQSYSGY